MVFGIEFTVLPAALRANRTLGAGCGGNVSMSNRLFSAAAAYVYDKVAFIGSKNVGIYDRLIANVPLGGVFTVSNAAYLADSLIRAGCRAARVADGSYVITAADITAVVTGVVKYMAYVSFAAVAPAAEAIILDRIKS